MESTTCIVGSGENMANFLNDATNNLIINMSGGLLPEHLTKDEVSLLVARYGDGWFEKLGYSEPEYKKPVF